MDITLSAVLVTVLALASVLIGRRFAAGRGGAGMQWVLSLAALSVALWTAWGIVQDHAAADSPPAAAAVLR